MHTTRYAWRSPISCPPFHWLARSRYAANPEIYHNGVSLQCKEGNVRRSLNSRLHIEIQKVVPNLMLGTRSYLAPPMCSRSNVRVASSPGKGRAGVGIHHLYDVRTMVTNKIGAGRPSAHSITGESKAKGWREAPSLHTNIVLDVRTAELFSYLDMKRILLIPTTNTGAHACREKSNKTPQQNLQAGRTAARQTLLLTPLLTCPRPPQSIKWIQYHSAFTHLAYQTARVARNTPDPSSSGLLGEVGDG